ncbi:MAG: acetyl-coenzyme A synthetase N-terminal domain-containing protein, partial [Gammaproteobacteria bacterium]
MNQPLWQPSAGRVAHTNMTAFIAHARDQWQVDIADYAGLYRWSIEAPEQFWQSVWKFCGVIAATPGGHVLVDGDRMPGARWFHDAHLNFAQNLLRRRDDGIALIFRGEDRVAGRITYAELHSEV